MKDLIIKYLDTTYPNISLRLNEESYIIYMYDNLTNENLGDWYVEKINIMLLLPKLFSCVPSESDEVLLEWSFSKMI